MSAPHQPHARRSLLLLVLTLGLLAFAGGTIYIVLESESVRASRSERLRSVAELQANTVADWYAEERLDAALIAQQGHVGDVVTSWLSAGEMEDLNALIDHLSAVRNQHDYLDVWITDDGGNVVYRHGSSSTAPSAECERAVREALSGGQPVASELYRNPRTGMLHLDIAAAVIDGTGTVIGTMVFRLDPRGELFERITEWPMPSRSGETLLLRREETVVRLLNDTRDEADTALQLTVPLERREVAAVRVARGGYGMISGKDYEGTPVIAYGDRIPETPWFLVTQMDRREAYAELYYKGGVTAAGAVALVALSASLMGWWYNRKRRLGMQALFEAEKHAKVAQFVMDNAHIAIYRVTTEGDIVYANQKASHCVGYSIEELTSMKIWELDPNLSPERYDEFRDQLAAEGRPTIESIHRRKDGSEFPVEIAVSYLEYEGEEYSFSFVQDISERKAHESELLQRIEEKELLLREIHHRVKNNLTVISSLLNLQALKMSHSPEAVSAIEKSRDRIKAMTLVHKMLYQTEDFTQISMKPYIESLVRDIMRMHASAARLQLQMDVSDISLDVNRAIPCGIIINELVTNAFKYAVPEDGNGSLHIGLMETEEGDIELSVSDDGPGLPEGTSTSQSLGMQLVQVLAQQVLGQLDIESTSTGSTFRVTFPIH